MNFLWRKIEWHGGEAAEVTGAAVRTGRIAVPEELDGLPVRRIGKGAFTGWDGLREAELPDSVREIGDFAFHGCRNLRRLALSCMTQEIGGGVLRECESLSLIEFGGFAVHPDLVHPYRGLCGFLSDSEAAFSVLLHFPDGDARLFFPDWVNDFDEDTMARAIHPRIEGCGYPYRECVSRDRIDFRGYDILFPRAVQDGTETASEAAFARLLWPYRLLERMEKTYRSYLLSHSEEVVPRLVADNDAERLSFLAREGLLSPPAVDAGLRLASAQGRAELCGILMDSAGQSGASGAEEFEL